MFFLHPVLHGRYIFSSTFPSTSGMKKEDFLWLVNSRCLIGNGDFMDSPGPACLSAALLPHFLCGSQTLTCVYCRFRVGKSFFPCALYWYKIPDTRVFFIPPLEAQSFSFFHSPEIAYLFLCS